MSGEYPLAAGTYTIESVGWPGQYVTAFEDTVVGYHHSIGSTQSWILKYDGDSATFQGVPDYPADGKYIALSEDYKLVYSDKPSKFRLEKVDENIYNIIPTYTPSNPEQGLNLQSKEDGTQINTAYLGQYYTQWKFT